jgi:chaperonin GroEL
MLQDIAVVTGAAFISEEVGKKLENTEVKDLGRCHRVVANKDNTTIVGGKGDKKEINNRISQLKAQIQKTESDFDKEKLQERLGKLSGGVAVIKVGAPTETAQKELKQRVEDSVSATRAAMEEGIVPGGGIALFNVNLERKKPEKHEAATAAAAASILGKALVAPLAAIISNSGAAPEEVIGELKNLRASAPDIWLGFNAMTGEITNLKEAGIVDPLKVVKEAFVNAVSVAANYLTAGAAIANIPEKKEKGGAPMGGMGEEY